MSTVRIPAPSSSYHLVIGSGEAMWSENGALVLDSTNVAAELNENFLVWCLEQGIPVPTVKVDITESQYDDVWFEFPSEMDMIQFKLLWDDNLPDPSDR